MRRAVGSLAGVALVCAAVSLLAPSTAAGATTSATSSSLRSLHCSPMPTDPALEAPLYAQDEGANGSPDGWWCQLPHATMVPPGFEQVVRSVAPLANLYADYQTEYAPATGATRATLNPGPTIQVTDDVNSSVAPPRHLSYPPLPKGTKVSLRHGVTASVHHQGDTTTVTWRFPLHGVPRYLRAVAEVTVRGSGVPGSAVVGVARHVRPD